MRNIIIFILLVIASTLSAQQVHDPTTNFSNLLPIGGGWCYVDTATPTWNPDLPAAAKTCRNAYNPLTGDLWLWENNKIAPGNGAWVKRGKNSTIPTAGPPAYTPTNPAEIVIDSNGSLWAWNGTSWVTTSATPEVLLGPGPYLNTSCGSYKIAVDTVGFDTAYYCNNGVFERTSLSKNDSVLTVANYTALRNVPATYTHDIINVADWTYTGPDGNTYTTIGGVFKKVLIGNENGGTVIVGAFKWERDHEDDKIRPEWWEVGGYDANGNLYTNKNTSSNGVYNETDRVIAASIVSGIGGTVELLKNKTYPIDRSVTANTGQKWEGNNATLFRVNSQTATLSAGSALGSNTITVTDATQFRVGQRIVILKTTAPNGGYAYDENVGMLDAYIITNIAGNVITLAVPLTAAVNSGWLVVQNTTLLVIETGTTTQLNEVVRLNFDGNRSGNNQSVDWRWHNSIYCVSSVESILIDHCQFTNSPSETIIMAGGTVSNCHYADLNTSFVHISKGVNNISSTTIIACTGKRSNQVANALASHSESTITSSANTSHVRVDGCYFEDGGESVFTVQSSQVLDYHVSNNTFKDYKYCWFGGASGGVKNEMKLIVNNNVFDNCGPIIMGTATPGSIYKNTGMSHVEINKNTFINTRIDISGIGYLSITYNNFYWDETRTYKYPYSTAGSINSNQAFFRISHMDRVHFIGNVVEHPMTYNADTQFGLMLLHANSVRKTSAGVDTEYLYSQDVKVNDNTFAGFKTSICNWQIASPQFLQEGKEAIGWEYKDNIVYMSRAVGSGGGTGIVVPPGCLAESNTIYTNSTAPAYAGMVVQGISNASGTNPQTRLMGGYAIDNKILGCGGATAADIVCNDGVRYNVTVVGNQTRDAIFNAVNGYFAQNWIINTTNYPALTAKTCPEWRFWQENFNQY